MNPLALAGVPFVDFIVQPLSDASFDDRSAQLTCVTCDSVFDLETGEPTEGPAADPVPVYPVREVEGWIEVLPHPSGDGSP